MDNHVKCHVTALCNRVDRMGIGCDAEYVMHNSDVTPTLTLMSNVEVTHKQLLIKDSTGHWDSTAGVSMTICMNSTLSVSVSVVIRDRNVQKSESYLRFRVRNIRNIRNMERNRNGTFVHH